MKIHTKPGFTLIELLTVIAIIGILAAILIPTVGKVRQNAQFTQNVSNVRQWTLANMMHAADWKGYVPYQGSGSLTVASVLDVTPFIGGVLPWWNALPPYINERTLAERYTEGGVNNLPRIGDRSVWVSPLAQLSDTGTPAWAAFLCYAPARSSNTPATNPAQQFVANINSVRDPSRTVMFGEAPHFTRALRQGVPYPFTNATTSPNALGPYNRNGTATERGGENGRAALGFFDGSVRVLTGRQIVSHGVNQDAERGQNPDGIVWRLTPN